MSSMILKKLVCFFALMAFIFTSVMPPSYAQSVFDLPRPGSMVSLSSAFTPVVLRGIKVDAQDPFKFEFLVDAGATGLKGRALEEESAKLIRYFLASVTTPEKDLWVNLSPYEKDRIIPEAFGTTEMGRDLLSQDYILKQIASSLMYPENEPGKAFWQQVYQQAYELYGTSDIPFDTFNKVWIVPESAEVYEDQGVAFVGASRLKVMLDSDYLASASMAAQPEATGAQEMTRDILRQVLLPVIEREVNEGQNFAQLRQVYQSLILAAWYKKRLKDTMLNKVFADRNKVAGIDIQDRQESEKIWARYVDAFKQGAYNYIKEEYDQYTQELIPRKYFSGGVNFGEKTDQAMSFKPLSRLSTFLAAGVMLFVAQVSLLPSAVYAQQGAPVVELALEGEASPVRADVFKFEEFRHVTSPAYLSDMDVWFDQFEAASGLVLKVSEGTEFKDVLVSGQRVFSLKIPVYDLNRALVGHMRMEAKGAPATTKKQTMTARIEFLGTKRPGTTFYPKIFNPKSNPKAKDLDEYLDKMLLTSQGVKKEIVDVIKSFKDMDGVRFRESDLNTISRSMLPVGGTLDLDVYQGDDVVATARFSLGYESSKGMLLRCKLVGNGLGVYVQDPGRALEIAAGMVKKAGQAALLPVHLAPPVIFNDGDYHFVNKVHEIAEPAWDPADPQGVYRGAGEWFDIKDLPKYIKKDLLTSKRFDLIREALSTKFGPGAEQENIRSLYGVMGSVAVTGGDVADQRAPSGSGEMKIVSSFDAFQVLNPPLGTRKVRQESPEAEVRIAPAAHEVQHKNYGIVLDISGSRASDSVDIIQKTLTLGKAVVQKITQTDPESLFDVADVRFEGAPLFYYKVVNGRYQVADPKDTGAHEAKGLSGEAALAVMQSVSEMIDQKQQGAFWGATHFNDVMTSLAGKEKLVFSDCKNDTLVRGDGHFFERQAFESWASDERTYVFQLPGLSLDADFEHAVKDDAKSKIEFFKPGVDLDLMIERLHENQRTIVPVAVAAPSSTFSMIDGENKALMTFDHQGNLMSDVVGHGFTAPDVGADVDVHPDVVRSEDGMVPLSLDPKAKNTVFFQFAPRETPATAVNKSGGAFGYLWDVSGSMADFTSTYLTGLRDLIRDTNVKFLVVFSDKEPLKIDLDDPDVKAEFLKALDEGVSSKSALMQYIARLKGGYTNVVRGMGVAAELALDQKQKNPGVPFTLIAISDGMDNDHRVGTHELIDSEKALFQRFNEAGISFQAVIPSSVSRYFYHNMYVPEFYQYNNTFPQAFFTLPFLTARPGQTKPITVDATLPRAFAKFVADSREIKGQKARLKISRYLIKEELNGKIRWIEGKVIDDLPTVDQAQMAGQYGGIDFNTGRIKLNVKGDGSALVNAVDPAVLARFESAPGLVPVMMDIRPVRDLPAFLGISQATGSGSSGAVPL